MDYGLFTLILSIHHPFVSGFRKNLSISKTRSGWKVVWRDFWTVNQDAEGFETKVEARRFARMLELECFIIKHDCGTSLAEAMEIWEGWEQDGDIWLEKTRIK